MHFLGISAVAARNLAALIGALQQQLYKTKISNIKILKL